MKGEVYDDLPDQKFSGYFVELDKKVVEIRESKIETASIEPKKRGRKKKK